MAFYKINDVPPGHKLVSRRLDEATIAGLADAIFSLVAKQLEENTFAVVIDLNVRADVFVKSPEVKASNTTEAT